VTDFPSDNEETETGDFDESPVAAQSLEDDDEDDGEDYTTDLDADSTLPSQAIVVRSGRPGAATAALVEGDESDPNALRKYVGRDGNYHVENPRARKAFEDYVNMGAARSLPRLAKHYLETKSPGWEKSNSEQAVFRKLAEYSTNLDWQNRLRVKLARESAQAVTNAQKNASRHRAERIRRAQKMQRIAEAIFDRAQVLESDVEALPPEVARALLKPATTMMQIGLAAERIEAGESLERLRPPKPIEDMTEEELDDYIENTLRAEL
jgi:hypothetical protein